MRLVWLLALAGCNQVYGLDETTIRPPEDLVDRDRDGVPDKDDVCPGVPDDQMDSDGDGFGNACDGCPAIKTAANHDEDGDTVGDECDRCPSDPDFQIDADKDGVGDICDNDFASQNNLLLFDAFLDIGPEYEQTGVWSVNNDAISGTAGSTLTTTSVMLDGTKPLSIALGVSLVQPFADGGNGFRLDLVDANGVVLGCNAVCDSTCRLQQVPLGNSTAIPVDTPPLTTLSLRRTGFVDACGLDATITPTPNGASPPVFGPVRIRLTGAPTFRFRFVSVWQ